MIVKHKLRFGLMVCEIHGDAVLIPGDHFIFTVQTPARLVDYIFANLFLCIEFAAFLSVSAS